MELSLQGKRAIVAGASAGLGLGCAKALAAEGAIVAMGSRTKGRIEAAAAEIPNAIPIVGDVSTSDGATDFVGESMKELGGVDILVTNAGGPPIAAWNDAELPMYEDALDLNLMSVIAMSLAAIPSMRKQKWGRIVAITSISVREPLPNIILSNTARAGATAFLKTLATGVAADGVTVNSLQPGLHLTDRVKAIYGDDVPDDAAAGIPTKKFGDPDDFGQVAAFLCSDAAKFITGAAIPIDGGAAGGLQ